MENVFAPYECQFSIEERKMIVAQAIREIRKGQNYSQKEVAGFLGISQPRYSGYETGRAEPPLEILVRLSYLYGITVDMLVQRDRLYRTSLDVSNQLQALREQLEQQEKQLMELGENSPISKENFAAVKLMLAELEKMNSNPDIGKLLESTLDE